MFAPRRHLFDVEKRRSKKIFTFWWNSSDFINFFAAKIMENLAGETFAQRNEWTKKKSKKREVCSRNIIPTLCVKSTFPFLIFIKLVLDDVRRAQAKGARWKTWKVAAGMNYICKQPATQIDILENTQKIHTRKTRKNLGKFSTTSNNTKKTNKINTLTSKRP